MVNQQNLKVAVIEFSDIHGRITDLGKFVAEELTTRLFLSGRFQVVERQLISKVLREQRLGLTGMLDEKSAKKVGQILGVDMIVTGTITDLGSLLKLNARTIAADTGTVHSVASAVLVNDGQISKLMGTKTEPGPGAVKTLKAATASKPAVSNHAGNSRKANSAGGIIVKGRLLFDGKPLSDYTNAAPRISIYSPGLAQWITPAFEYDPETALISLRVISEGGYSCEVRVNADHSNPDLYPGDYKGYAHFSAFAASPPAFDIDMERIIHLSTPEDNGVPMAGWGAACFNKIIHEAPIHLNWEGIDNDVYYTYTINRTECDPFAEKELVTGDTITATSVNLDLAPNKEKEIYLLRIVARKDGRNVGSLMTHGGNGWGWDYRFRVVR
ncbi:MAG: hypothetical protein A2X58_06480 [Nitrospirae bacterium GWC2_56_14]|nr:MAG: hypothetical protein A2X58_06480 [Nitrospirae bacterium GWC2_56_14]